MSTGTRGEGRGGARAKLRESRRSDDTDAAHDIGRRGCVSSVMGAGERARDAAYSAADGPGAVMATRRATGHIRVLEREQGPVLYAKRKLPDGREPQRRLGLLWTRRTRPPAGYLTRGQAEARLEAMLSVRIRRWT